MDSGQHRSAPKEQCPQCLSMRGPLGDTPPTRNQTVMGPWKAPEGTNTKVTSAKGHFCAYPNPYEEFTRLAETMLARNSLTYLNADFSYLKLA